MRASRSSSRPIAAVMSSLLLDLLLLPLGVPCDEVGHDERGQDRDERHPKDHHEAGHGPARRRRGDDVAVADRRRRLHGPPHPLARVREVLAVDGPHDAGGDDDDADRYRDEDERAAKRAHGVPRLQGSACTRGRCGHAPEFVPAGRCPSALNHPVRWRGSPPGIESPLGRAAMRQPIRAEGT